MDKLGLLALRAEMNEDLVVISDAVATARTRFDAGETSDLEGCAIHLLRAYNGIENMALRIARAFEGEPKEGRDWHTQLIRRLMLEIPGVRPAFFDPGLAAALSSARAFRHVLVHAYDLVLDRSRLLASLTAVEEIAERLPSTLSTFFARCCGPE